MELYYTPKARNDLLQIKESIIEKFDDEDLAKKILRKMTETVRQLITFPYLGAGTFRDNRNIYRLQMSFLREKLCVLSY